MRRYVIKLFTAIISFLAKRLILSKTPFVIGVTGSIWKTTCRNIIFQTIEHAMPDVISYTPSKNYNNEIGLCLGIFRIDDYKPTIFGRFRVISIAIKRLFSKKKYDILVLEYGIDAPGDMDFLLDICTPDIGIITKIDLVHSMNFQNKRENIFLEKSKLISKSKSTVFLNIDDNFITTEYLDSITIDKILYSNLPDRWDIYYNDFKLYKNDNNNLFSETNINIWDKLTHLSTNLINDFMLWYVTIGMTIIDIYNHRHWRKAFMDPKLIINYRLEPWRFNLIPFEKGIIIDSTYNASPQSVLTTIDNSFNIKNKFYPEAKIIFILGEMRELWSNSEQSHRVIADNLIWHSDLYAVIRVSKDAKYAYHYIQGKAKWYKNYFVDNAIDVEHVLGDIVGSFQDDQKFIIIFKSSQGEIFLEEAIKPWIDRKYYNTLPRQDTFWAKKKRQLGKYYIMQ